MVASRVPMLRSRRQPAASPMIASMLDRYGSAVVTGGVGFVGHWLVAALDRLGKAVTVVDNAVTATGLPLPPNVTLSGADIRDAGQIRSALTAADLVFHVAGNASGTLSVTNPR